MDSVLDEYLLDYTVKMQSLLNPEAALCTSSVTPLHQDEYRLQLHVLTSAFTDGALSWNVATEPRYWMNFI